MNNKGNTIMTSASVTSDRVEISSEPESKVKIFAVLFFLAGLTLVTVLGLGQAHTLHNAAHDTRHSLGFPCH